MNWIFKRPSDWYFGPVVLCLLSRIFFWVSLVVDLLNSHPQKTFRKKKVHLRGNISPCRISAWVPWLKQKNREGKHNQTRKISEWGYYSRRNEKLTLCVENFGVLFNVGGLPPPTENARPPSFFLFESDYQTVDERNNFLFSLSSPPFEFLWALSSFRLNKSRLCLWWRHFDTIRRRPPIREGGRPTPVEISNENVVVGCFSHVWSLVCNECNS